MPTTMNISLPDNLRAFVDQAVADGGYASVSEYMRELVRKAKAQKEVEGQVREGLESSDLGEFDKTYFKDLKRKLKGPKGRT